ncbi:tetratricopeptide repeat protein [Streptomyces sp. NPDC002788]
MPPRTTDSAPERRDGDGPPTVPDPGSGGPEPVGRDARPAAEAVAGEQDARQEDAPAAGEPRPHPASGHGAVDQRVTAIRRAADGGRRWRRAHLAGCAALLAVALTGGAIAFGGARERGTGVDAVSAAGALSPGDLARGDLDAGIVSLQRHLRGQPRDFGGWATLGVAYVEQARTKGDPSRYPQAERALERSLGLKPGNDQALAGRAALAAARHDFPGALKHADRALRENPYNERALCTRIDALVELGRYDDAAEAARTADDRRPGVPVFTRYAYVHELRGDVRTAREVLERALDSADAPADIAYVATAQGQLAWNQGEYEAALSHYARALAADDEYLPALEGRARAQAANGDRASAVQGLEQIVARYPLPGPLVALGELYEDRGADGDRAKAGDQYALVDAWTALARAGGVNADLDSAMAAADHGDEKEALRAARAEWDRRRSVHTADALAWALHVNGRDEEALPYARRATATGYRSAAFLYHRGIIERATGDERGARAHLKAALDLNPGFSPLGAREARTALEDLEANR